MNSEAIFEKACGLMPGGVNSPVRAYRAVGMTPPFIERAEGAHISMWTAINTSIMSDPGGR